MTTIHKIELYIVDHDSCRAESIKNEIESYRYLNMQVLSIQSVDIGSWHDLHPLNFTETAKAEIERLFG